MAKKKKHKKTNRSRKARLQSTAPAVVTGASEVAASDTEVVTKSQITVEKPAKTGAEITYDDVDLAYVKEDITKTIVLIGIILGVYLVLWLLMTYTNIGTQLIHSISR